MNLLDRQTVNSLGLSHPTFIRDSQPNIHTCNYGLVRSVHIWKYLPKKLVLLLSLSTYLVLLSILRASHIFTFDLKTIGHFESKKKVIKIVISLFLPILIFLNTKFFASAILMYVFCYNINCCL